MTDFAELRREIKACQAEGFTGFRIDVEQAIALLAALDAARAPKVKAKPVPRYSYTPADEKVAQWIYEQVVSVSASAKEPIWSAWANEIRMMREIDKRTLEQICALFQWANADSFWCSNILSPKKLREKWDQLAVRRGGIRRDAQLGKAGQSTANAARELMEGR